VLGGTGTYFTVCIGNAPGMITAGGFMLEQCAQCGTTTRRWRDCRSIVARQSASRQPVVDERTLEYDCISHGKHVVFNLEEGERMECGD
jgi:hypothetical protein